MKENLTRTVQNKYFAGMYVYTASINNSDVDKAYGAAQPVWSGLNIVKCSSLLLLTEPLLMLSKMLTDSVSKLTGLWWISGFMPEGQTASYRQCTYLRSIAFSQIGMCLWLSKLSGYAKSSGGLLSHIYLINNWLTYSNSDFT